MLRFPPGSSRRRGFTLLEVLVAMTFVALLASGIVLSISTALRVWKLTLRQNEVNQEARAIMELLSRDIRGAYVVNPSVLPLRNGGFFIAPSPLGQTTGTGATLFDYATPSEPIDSLFLTTDSPSAREASFLPDNALAEWNQEQEAPISDMLAVEWKWQGAVGGDDPRPAGLYRLTYVLPTADPESVVPVYQGEEPGLVRVELVSTAVKSLRLKYAEPGDVWDDAWDSNAPVDKGGRVKVPLGLPQQVEITLELNDPTEDATTGASGVSKASAHAPRYVFRDVVTIATR